MVTDVCQLYWSSLSSKSYYHASCTPAHPLCSTHFVYGDGVFILMGSYADGLRIVTWDFAIPGNVYIIRMTFSLCACVCAHARMCAHLHTISIFGRWSLMHHVRCSENLHWLIGVQLQYLAKIVLLIIRLVNPSCHVSALVPCPPCPVSVLSFVRPVLCLACPLSALSCICPVLCPPCPVSALSDVYTELCTLL